MHRFLISFLVILITTTTNAQVKISSYQYAPLFDSLMVVKPNDIVFIQNPSGEALYGAKSYNYVFPGDDEFMHPVMRQRMSGLNGSRSYKARIKTLFTFEGEGTLYAKVEDVSSNQNFYVSIVSAIASNEVVPETSKAFDRYKAFLSYLKQANTINDNTGILYLNAFEPVKEGLDEFEKRRVIADAKAKCEALKNAKLETQGYIYFGSVELGEYDFDKKGFTLKEMAQTEKYNLRPSEEVSSSLLSFSNMPEDYFLAMDEKSAEAVVNFYKQYKLPRKLYYIYTYDLTGASVESGVERQWNGSMPVKLFVQHAAVKSIRLYGDKNYQAYLDTRQVPADK